MNQKCRVRWIFIAGWRVRLQKRSGRARLLSKRRNGNGNGWRRQTRLAFDGNRCCCLRRADLSHQMGDEFSWTAEAVLYKIKYFFCLTDLLFRTDVRVHMCDMLEWLYFLRTSNSFGWRILNSEVWFSSWGFWWLSERFWTHSKWSIRTWSFRRAGGVRMWPTGHHCYSPDCPFCQTRHARTSTYTALCAPCAHSSATSLPIGSIQNSPPLWLVICDNFSCVHA